jgi:hypothetical protein
MGVPAARAHGEPLPSRSSNTDLMQLHHADPFRTAPLPSYRSRVIENGQDLEHANRLSEAQRMVSDQAGCSMSDALSLIQNTAEATDETVAFIAAMVLNRAVRFDGFA